MIAAMMPQKLAGVKADVSAGVTIGTVFSGYFNSMPAARAFFDIGIAPILGTLPPEVQFADFGGGDGFLAAQVRDYLTVYEHHAYGLVVDMNDAYLLGARRRGFKALAASLDEVSLAPLDLIVARAILHYNPLRVQQAIVSNIYRSLKSGGYFVHSPSSGDAANCALRTEIAALKTLGRTNGDGSVYFIVPDDYIQMAQNAGFADTKLAGYAPDNAWTLSEMFVRFNPVPMVEDTAYLARKWQFIQDALALIIRYQRETAIRGITLLDGEARISYRYPVFVSRKA